MKVRRWMPPAVWAAIILIMTSVPNPELPSITPAYSDKLAHATAYAVLGWLSVRAAWRPTDYLIRSAVLLVGILLFAAVDEWHQRFVPGRYADPSDWLADSVGAAAGIALATTRLRRERYS